LEKIIKRLDSTHQELLAAVTPLDSEHFTQQPAENEWSIAEVVHHLCLVEERVIEDLVKQLAAEPQTVGLLHRLVPTSIVASRRIRVKAPKAVTPSNPPEKSVAIESFNRSREKLKQLCSKYGRDRLRHVVVNHPFLGKIDGTAAVSFVGYHELRHLKQIREILKKIQS
jgi:DinB superfamily